MKAKLFFFTICMFIMLTIARAQVSFDVGYTGSTFADNKFRPLIRAFNSYLPNSAKNMKRMNYMNGLHFSISSTELPVNVYMEYNGTFVSLSAKRLINSSNAQYNYILNFSDNAVGPGLIFGSGSRVKAGATLLYNFISIKQFTSDDNKRILLQGDDMISVKPYFDVKLGAEEDRVNASLRFFANIPMKKTNLNSVSTAMDPENRSELEQDQLNTRLTTLGISFILHNKRY